MARSLRSRARQLIADALRPLNKPRVYRARHGLARGLKQVGGLGLVLPGPLREPPEYPEFEGLEDAFLERLDLEGKTIYDVGAFKGILTMFFAVQTRPHGQVVAFEPHPESYSVILRHLELNDLTNVTVRNIGVGDGPGELTLASPPGRGRTTADEGIKQRLQSTGEVELLRVTVNSLDDEIGSASLPDPDFVKVDVEGMEVPVLQGMQKTMARCKPKVYVEVHGATTEAKRANAEGVIELLTASGYTLRHVESDQPVAASNADVALRGHIYGE